MNTQSIHHSGRPKYFFDTEFNEDGRTIDLISIGIVSHDGREYYAVNEEANLYGVNEWVKQNVITQLPPRTDSAWKSRARIAADVKLFMPPETNPEIWAYFSSYDWLCFCQLFGTMMDLRGRKNRMSNETTDSNEYWRDIAIRRGLALESAFDAAEVLHSRIAEAVDSCSQKNKEIALLRETVWSLVGVMLEAGDQRSPLRSHDADAQSDIIEEVARMAAKALGIEVPDECDRVTLRRAIAAGYMCK